MGCDIHVVPQRLRDGEWQSVDLGKECPRTDQWNGLPQWTPFEHRNYSVFAFLAGVRNYSGVLPLSEPRGMPVEGSPWDDDDDDYYHSHSWLSIAELSGFDYDQPVEDRRTTKTVFYANGGKSIDGGHTADVGEGQMTTYREFLGEWFFKDLEDLKKVGVDRIIFAFDS